MIHLNIEEPMGHTILKNAALERKELVEGRETATTGSQGAGGRTIDKLAVNGAQRRMTKAEGSAPKGAGVGGKAAMGRKPSDIGDLIGRELRGMFDEVVAQPVPDRFLDLLNKLETSTISPGVGSKTSRER